MWSLEAGLRLSLAQAEAEGDYSRLEQQALSRLHPDHAIVLQVRSPVITPPQHALLRQARLARIAYVT